MSNKSYLCTGTVEFFVHKGESYASAHYTWTLNETWKGGLPWQPSGRLHTSSAGMQGVWVWSLVTELTNGSVVKNRPANAGDARDTGSIPGWGIPLGEGNGNPLEHSCLEISMDREAWQAIVHGVVKNGTWQCTHIQCRELRSYMLHGAAKKNKQKQNREAEGRQCSLLTQNGINH